jgi:dihydrofolate reductase
MRKIIYLMNVSLDGFVEGPDGKFGWSMPDEEVHRFHNEIARGMGGFLYGRRMYETMAGWQTIGKDAAAADYPDYALEFAGIWREKPKVVFSTTLEKVGPNCRLVRAGAAEEAARMKGQAGGDLGVSGPSLASTLIQHGLVDEIRLIVFPVLVGGGKSYFPVLGHPVLLDLVETLTFRCKATYLRYMVKLNTI